MRNLLIPFFYPSDAEEILKIRIPSFNGEDFVAWAHEPNGLFSVRSAYRLGMQLKQLNNQSSKSSNPGGDRNLWKLI